MVSPLSWIEQTRKLVPPRSTARYKPFSLLVLNYRSMPTSLLTFSVPLGTPVTYVGIWLMAPPSLARPSSVKGSDCARIPETTFVRTHLSHELSHGLPDIIVRQLELCGHPLCFCCKSHCVRFRDRRFCRERRRGLASRPFNDVRRRGESDGRVRRRASRVRGRIICKVKLNDLRTRCQPCA